MTQKNEIPHVVTLGGGGGHAAVLRALKDLPLHITAITNVVDNGGGSGRLMQDYDVHHPGEPRQALGALAQKYCELLSYRFADGQFKGQTLGNLLVTGLECATGSIEKSILILKEWLGIEHIVSPVTLEKVVLHAKTKKGNSIKGQREITLYTHEHKEDALVSLSVDNHQALLAPLAKEALKQAEYIVVCMGDLYGSIAPLFCMDNLQNVLENSDATLVWLPNVIAPLGHVHYQTLALAQAFFQTLYPAFKPKIVIVDSSVSKRPQEGYIYPQDDLQDSGCMIIRESLLSEREAKRVPGDIIARSPVYYDTDKLQKVFKRIFL